MGTNIIKDYLTDNQASVNNAHELLVSGSFTPGGTTDSNIIEVGGVAITLGQTTSSLSFPVTIASDQSPLPIAGAISGTVNSNLLGLNVFQTSQQTIGSGVSVQLTPTPLSTRSSMSIKVKTTTSTDIVYIGPTSSVTTSNGYALFNGDSIQLDLTPLHQIWAIGSSAGQLIYILEIGS